MSRPGRALLAGALGLAGLVAFSHRSRHVATGRSLPGGVVMGDVGGYDVLSRFLFGSLFRRIAGDVVATAPGPGRILEVGCGPGWLSIELARRDGLEVTGLDLDPAMIERARAHAAQAELAGPGADPRPSFLVGDVAALPFGDASFDLVVSTFSMHHWADRSAGLAEIARVVRPGGRVLIWDLRAGSVPFHPKKHRSADHVAGSPLGPASVTAWRWPFRLALADRIAFTRP